MSQLFEEFSSKENLKRAYLYVQNELAHSSLSVNPINHPATTAINDFDEDFFIALEQCLRDGNYKPEKGFFVYMPKDNLGIRPVCVPSMVDRVVYQALFNQRILGHKIDGQLSDKICFANRVSDEEDDEYFLNQYFSGWNNFCKEQEKAFAKGYLWKLEVDVQQYYEHIPIGKLLEKLKNNFDIKDEKILAILKEQLCAWVEYPELPKGIPQGPEASAILGNAYLSSLDAYAEKELIGKELCYFRYADDITLMGKTKKDVLKTTEKIVRFLREHNLTLNEKTKLTKLVNTKTIEALRFFSDYEDNTPEIPEDEFTKIQNKVPIIITSIQEGEKVEKSNISELKYFLKIDTEYHFNLMKKLIEIIPLRPSLTVPIIQYISEGRVVLNSINTSHIDSILWNTYTQTEISEWSRFWIFKLIASNKSILIEEIDKEVERILSSKENTIFKIVCFYYQIIQEKEVDIEKIKQAINGSKTDVEKSLYFFFLLNTSQDTRIPVIKNYVEKLLNNPSHELNLIGSYLFKNKPKISINNIEGIFANYLLKRGRKKENQSENIYNKNFANGYFVRSENLIPITSATSVFGTNRPRKKKNTIELEFPETVQWNKVKIKIKEGKQEIEIFYNNNHIKTADYVDLGFFTGKKQQKQDRQWGFLCALSVLSATDIKQATANEMCRMVAINTNTTLSINNIHQIKRTLTNRLRILFKTSDNPFYERRDYYEPKFTILPEPILRQEEVWSSRLYKNTSQEPKYFLNEDNEISEENTEEAF